MSMYEKSGNQLALQYGGSELAHTLGVSANNDMTITVNPCFSPLFRPTTPPMYLMFGLLLKDITTMCLVILKSKCV